ncbi:uncharacterized protein LOC133736183 [Rosa rugosa]|uniref:uncharacterized protein LOC133736183 n=1 Tax=Rosa rugosa TaxID=74645 RepID=UPI002B411491|nr:uncharacterized protein LOC133736183 [Rosa rugosa]
MPRSEVAEVNQEARQSYFLVGQINVPIRSSTQDIRNGNSDHNTNDLSAVHSAGELNMEARPQPITSTTTSFLVGQIDVPIRSSNQDIRNGNSDHNTNDFSAVHSTGEVNMEARSHPITSPTTSFLVDQIYVDIQSSIITSGGLVLKKNHGETQDCRKGNSGETFESTMDSADHPIFPSDKLTRKEGEMQQLPDKLAIIERVAKSKAQLGALKESERGSSRINQSTAEGRCTSSGTIKKWGEGCSRQSLGRGVNIQRSVKNRYHPLLEDSEIEEQEEEHPEEENTKVLLAAAREAAKRPKKVEKRLRQKQKDQQWSSLGAPTLLLVCFFLLLATLYSNPQP